MQSAQNWHRQRATDGVNGTRDRSVVVLENSIRTDSRDETESGRSAQGLGIDDTTAPIAAECQSFLDNVIAQAEKVGQKVQVCREGAYRWLRGRFSAEVDRAS